MKSKRFYIIFVFTIFILISIFSQSTFANSAEPPSIIFIVPGISDDVNVYFSDGDNLVSGGRHDFPTETHFTFYHGDFTMDSQINFVVKTKNDSFEVTANRGLDSYRNVYTIDMKSHTLTPGTTKTRDALLIGFRVGFTLIIEGLIFWFFGFREKRSWVVFLLMNLLTQGVLNVYLSNIPMYYGYIILNLIFVEFFVFAAELILINLFIKEQSLGRRSGFVFTANFASLILGGFLITRMPL